MKLSLIWRLLARDWRGGELGILIVALILAVSVIVGISSFVTRLQSALMSESARFLAADLVVVSRSELPIGWAEEAAILNLQATDALGFPSMAVADIDHMAMVSIKAVADGYPLRGTLQWSAEPYGQLRSDATIPLPGQVWLAPRLFSLLAVEPGDQITVGETLLTVSGSVRSEPDATTAVFGFGPRLLMNTADIPATGVVQPGSRVEYRLMLSGPASATKAFEDWVTPQLQEGQRVQSIEGTQPRIGDTLDRAQGFLLLAGSLAVVLAAAAITLASRRFGVRHTQYVAILKSLGAQAHEISQLYGASLFCLGAVTTVVGCAIGWLMQEAFIVVLGSLLPITPGAAGGQPFLMGVATSAVCLACFAWPPLSRLGHAPPLLVLRADMQVDDAQKTSDFLLGGAAIVALMWWYSGSATVTAAVVAGLVIVIALGFVVARLLLSGGRKVGGFAGSIWRIALAGLQRRGRANALQMVIFAITIMLMLLLSVVRSSLISQWQDQLPPGVPNHFMLNLAPTERSLLTEFFDRNGIRSEALYPMTRGRVIAVNDSELPEWDETETNDSPRQRGANFTWSDTVPAGNALVEGDWWAADTDEAWVSIEADFAEGLGAQVGDQVSLRIGADILRATIKNIREVDWQSMRPNFFMVFPRAVLEPYPGMVMTSFLLAADQKSLLNKLVVTFPTVTVIELDVVIEEMRSVISQVARALELVLGVILLAGALVLVAGVQSSVDGRLKESALLRALGARRQVVLGTLWIEFLVLGALAGLLGSAGAEAAAWGLQTAVFDMTWAPTLLMWWLGPLLGALIVGALGVWSCRSVVNTPPVILLREA